MWFFVGFAFGAMVGVLVIAACAAGAHAGLSSELAECRARLVERPSGDAA